MLVSNIIVIAITETINHFKTINIYTLLSMQVHFQNLNINCRCHIIRKNARLVGKLFQISKSIDRSIIKLDTDVKL